LRGGLVSESGCRKISSRVMMDCVEGSLACHPLGPLPHSRLLGGSVLVAYIIEEVGRYPGRRALPRFCFCAPSPRALSGAPSHGAVAGGRETERLATRKLALSLGNVAASLRQGKGNRLHSARSEATTLPSERANL